MQMETRMPRPDELAAEFNMLMARAGLAVPADQLEGLLAGYAGLLEQAAMLRSARTAAAEPANVFRLHRLAGA